MSSKPRIVITGLGLTAPNGNSLGEFRANLLAGKARIAVIDVRHMGKHPAGVCDFDVTKWQKRKEIRNGTRVGSISIFCAREALGDSGLSWEKVDKSRVGVYLGITEHGNVETENEVHNLSQFGNDTKYWTHHHNPRTVANNPAGEVTMNMGITGPHYTIGAACAAGNAGLIQAAQMLQLGEVDRCRKVYAKYIEVMPFCVTAWCDFAGLERTVGETVRARSIFEVAVEQPQLDAPEVLWKAYIDFETEEREHAKVRALYERLLQRAGHVKVWIAFALFEASLAAEASSSSDAGAGAVAGAGVDRATEAALASRKVLASAYSALKSEGFKEERVLLLEAWRSIETALPPTVRDLAKPEGMMPRKIKARRMVTDESGQELGWEEYYDYVFPDDEKKVTGLKILENALKWKAAMGAGAGAGAGADADKVDDESSSSSSSSSLGKRKAEEELNIDDV